MQNVVVWLRLEPNIGPGRSGVCIGGISLTDEFVCVCLLLAVAELTVFVDGGDIFDVLAPSGIGMLVGADVELAGDKKGLRSEIELELGATVTYDVPL